MADTSAFSSQRLTAPVYHQQLVALLKSSEPQLWQWASSAQAERDHAQQVRTHLLKQTYRLDEQGHAAALRQAAAVAARLEINAPITLYQALGGSGMNASLFYLPGEVHIVFTGAVLDTLSGSELDAVLGHELAHYRLWEIEGRDFLTAERLLAMAANDDRAAMSHIHTSRRLQLYTEIYADRGALVGSGKLQAAVAALVKTATGLQEVSARSYLRQAEEIFANHEGSSTRKARSRGVDHPETFIRARALRLWAEGDEQVDRWLGQVIEGGLSLQELDLLGQHRLAAMSRQVITELLDSKWFRTPATLAHACAYFPDFNSNSAATDPQVAEALGAALGEADIHTREYLCYLLLDFAVIDRDLEEASLAAAFSLSDRLGLGEIFESITARELRIGKRQLSRLRKNAAKTLARAAGAP